MSCARLMGAKPRRVDHDQVGLAMTAYAFEHISRGLSCLERNFQNLRIHAKVFDGSQAAGIERDQSDRSVFLKPVMGHELHDCRGLAYPARPDKHGDLVIVHGIQQGPADSNLFDGRDDAVHPESHDPIEEIPRRDGTEARGRGVRQLRDATPVQPENGRLAPTVQGSSILPSVIHRTPKTQGTAADQGIRS